MYSKKLIELINENTDIPVFFLFDRKSNRRSVMRRNRFEFYTNCEIRKTKILHDYKINGNQIFVKDRDLFFLREELLKNKNLKRELVTEIDLNNYIEKLPWEDCILVSTEAM